MGPPNNTQTDGSSGPGAPSEPPTVAAFSPTNISGASLTSKQRSTIIVHRKSPLLVATPPAVTRALAYSHPFLLPLNRLAGLLTWTSGDPWQSFLLVAGFWAITLYGDVFVLWAAPILVVVGLILGMYSRRYSPLSSTSLTGEKRNHQRGNSESSGPQSKTLDEIVETLRTLTTRCNILLEPLLELTDFLSTQRTATTATTRPALTALLTRIILVTPVWILLTLPPFHLVTTRRVIVAVGTIILTWHSKAARISRVILWRSTTVRRICSVITGLSFPNAGSTDEKTSFESSSKEYSGLSLRTPRSNAAKDAQQADNSVAKRRRGPSGIRFTFILYENQRRWIGIGWTYSLFAYERAAWTDEHLNPAPSKDQFELPEVSDGNSKWRWVPGSEWRVEGVGPESPKKTRKGGKNDNGKEKNDGGWIYYDNKWNDGRRGQDGWGRYTRRRKWCRDAELVEITSSLEPSRPPSRQAKKASPDQSANNADDNNTNGGDESKDPSKRKRRWFSSGETVSKSPPSSSPPTITASSLPNLGGVSDETSKGKTPSISSSRSAPHPGMDRGLSYDGATGPGGGRSSGRSSVRGRRGSRTGSSTADGGDRKSQSLSLREKEIEEAQDTVDQWGSRPGGTAERAERSWGLGDDAHMGLS